MHEFVDDQEQKTFSAIYRALIAHLARREHSVAELIQKLTKRFPQDERRIHLALEKAITDGYQSDQRFAQAYARSRINKGFGSERIAIELKQKGIASDLIEDALVEVQEQDAESSALHRTWEKKFKTPPRDFNEKMKQIRFLRYRGFSAEQVEQFYRRLDTGGEADS